MIASFVFLGFTNLVLCANDNERKSHKPSDPDASNNHSNMGYGNSQISYQDGGRSSLFDSKLNHNNQSTKISGFVPYNQDARLNQTTSHPIHLSYEVPNLMTFGKILPKPQGLSLQAPISNFYPKLDSQPSTVSQFTFNPVILSQKLEISSNKSESNKAIKTFKPDQTYLPINNQNTIISDPLQLFPISSDQIQEFQKLIYEIGISLGNHKINSGKLNQTPTGRKTRRKQWKAYEFNNLLKGVNEYGTQWKKIFNLYKFEEGRETETIRSQFRDLKKKGRIIYTKEFKWKFVSQNEVADLVRGEEENEQIQNKKGSQEDAELVDNEGENESGNTIQNKVGEMIENSSQEKDQKGPFFVGANKRRRWVSWKRYELVNLLRGANMYGKNWEKTHKSLKFEQERTPAHLSQRFYKLKKDVQVTFIKGLGWKFVTEKDSSHSDENEPSKATGNQIQGKGQKQIQKQKRHQLPWKKRELDNLLKGVNKYGRNWKKIFNSYEFKEGRISRHLHSKFSSLEKNGEVTYKEGLGWKYTDLYEEKVRNKVVFERESVKGPFKVEKTRRANQDLSVVDVKT